MVASKNPWAPLRGKVLAANSCLLLLALTGGLRADDDPRYQRIEEDWEVIVGTPDPVTGSPQIAFDMAPHPLSPKACLFLLNYRDAPSFRPGGIHVQLWEDDYRLSWADNRHEALAVPQEHITFTLFMQRDGQKLRYGVVRGEGDTWGEFGSDDFAVACDDARSSFSNYRSEHSVDNATIILGATRVESLKLLQVRKFRSNSPVVDVEPTRVVYP